MSVEQRAKIFLPFAGVRGLDEALERKRREHFMEERIILGEDGEREIDDVLSSIAKGDKISLSSYEDGYYVEKEGTVIKKDAREGYILMESGPVYFRDIHSIEKKDTNETSLVSGKVSDKDA